MKSKFYIERVCVARGCVRGWTTSERYPYLCGTTRRRPPWHTRRWLGKPGASAVGESPVSGQLGPSHAWNAPLTRWVVLPGPQNNSACQLSLSTPTTGAHIYPLAFWPCLVYLRLRPVPHRSQRWKSRARWNSPLDYAWTIGQTKSSSTRFDSKLCHA